MSSNGSSIVSTLFLVTSAILFYVSLFSTRVYFPASFGLLSRAKPPVSDPNQSDLRVMLRDLCSKCMSCSYPTKTVWKLAAPEDQKENKEVQHLFAKVSDGLNEFCNACEATKQAYDEGKKPAPLPTISKDFTLEPVTAANDNVEEEHVAESGDDVDEQPSKLSRRQKRTVFTDDADRLDRTLFIGNLPVACCKDKKMQRELRNIFSPYGTVESMRFRSIGISKALPKKVAIITGQLHGERDSINGYVVMSKSEEAKAALKENARTFHDHHLRIDIATGRSSSGGKKENAETEQKHHDTKRSVFIGNLPLNINDEVVWKAFEGCGSITNVRIIRDKATNLGKGFGYVTFAEKASVEMAVLMAGTDCGGRPIRVQKCAKEGYRKAQHLRLQKLDEQKVQEAEWKKFDGENSSLGKTIEASKNKPKSEMRSNNEKKISPKSKSKTLDPSKNVSKARFEPPKIEKRNFALKSKSSKSNNNSDDLTKKSKIDKKASISEPPAKENSKSAMSNDKRDGKHRREIKNFKEISNVEKTKKRKLSVESSLIQKKSRK